MKLDELTRQSVSHTLHCLLGCSIGEVLGMAIGQYWNNILQTATGITLAFFFGYLLTFYGAYRQGMVARDAIKLALAIDTVSIVSMVIIDNTLEWLIPGAINAHLVDFLFWWSQILSLSVAFIFTVPVNRYMISHGLGGHNHMHHHR